MKNLALFIAVCIAVFFNLLPSFCAAQSKTFEISTDKENGSKVLKGLLTRSDIDKDTSYKWFLQNYKLGQADAPAVAAFQKNAAKFQMVIFFGTWCDDSQNLLPVFYRLADKAGYAQENITLIGVDRPKTTLDNLHTAFNITNVPTFIVMKDGKEIGRVVEYGKYGQIDKELGEIVSQIQ
ncbi:MAG TPA: thioredoxin family protein [Panacibacter sp.]|nr:thioredoxin family protein [Panacibacter sp.]